MEYFNRVKFPCGYEHFVLLKLSAFDSHKLNGQISDLKVCPMHGARCPK